MDSGQWERLTFRARRNEGGYALLIVLAMIGLSALYFAVRYMDRAVSWRTAPVSRLAPRTADALRQAKEALIGYAATYPDSHTGQAFGYLPTPDMGTSRDQPPPAYEGDTGGNFTGNGLEMSAIGRFPWRALRLPPLTDEYGECLWYAVSGSHQQGTKSNLQPMNWDTVSYLDAYSPDGTTSLSNGNPHNRVIAVIFSPGPPLPGQNRAKSATDDVSICGGHPNDPTLLGGGNYDAVNYLDANAGLSNYFPAPAPNHATGAGAPPPTAPKQLLASPMPGNTGSQTLNDRVVVITADDIFRAVQQRQADIQNIIADAASYVANCKIDTNNLNRPDYPYPAHNGDYSAAAGVKRGRLPDPAGDCVNTTMSTRLTNWQDNFFYVVCTGLGDCMHGTDQNGIGFDCHAAVIFAGRRGSKVGGGTQSRTNSTERGDFRNYLEGQNYQTFATNSKDLDGRLAYSRSTPTADVVSCLH